MVLSLQRNSITALYKPIRIAKVKIIFEMATRKKYKLDLLGSLKALKPGQSVTFIVAGRGQETTKGAVYATKYIHQLPVQITMTDNGTKAVVTAE